MKQGYFIGALAAMLLASAPAAHAAFQITSDPGFTATGGYSMAHGNDVIGNIGVSNIGAGQFSTGSLGVTGGGSLSVYYLGAESGFKNSLNIGGQSFTETGGSSKKGLSEAIDFHTAIANGPKITVGVSAGTLGFDFAANGATILENAGASLTLTGANVAYAYFDVATASVVTFATDWVLFALDDGGSGPDFDFDDYVGLMHVTPIPAGIWLMASGVAALAGYRRARSTKTA